MLKKIDLIKVEEFESNITDDFNRYTYCALMEKNFFFKKFEMD